MKTQLETIILIESFDFIMNTMPNTNKSYPTENCIIANPILLGELSIGAHLGDKFQIVSYADFIHPIMMSDKESKETGYGQNLPNNSYTHKYVKLLADQKILQRNFIEISASANPSTLSSVNKRS